MFVHSCVSELRNFEPDADEVRALILRGLQSNPKTLPSKLLYDERGSLLFEEICRLEEYYPTRTESLILQDNLKEVTDLISEQTVFVDLGSGNAAKASLLLENSRQPYCYIPVDISRKQLTETADIVRSRFPGLRVIPVCADYTRDFRLPDLAAVGKQALFFFPGSTVGNFEPAEARAFIERLMRLSPGLGFLVGVDLKKDRDLIERAYNDKAGVTAAFNLNLISRVAREFGIEDLSSGFVHKAHFNEMHGRIEMHLISKIAQVWRLSGQEISFAEGESIVTEYSYKYSIEEFSDICRRAGLKLQRIWTDSRNMFSLQFYQAVEGREPCFCRGPAENYMESAAIS